MRLSAVGRYRQDKLTVRVNETRHLIDLPRFLRYGLQVFLDAGRAMYNTPANTP
jgi:hypothetical protein